MPPDRVVLTVASATHDCDGRSLSPGTQDKQPPTQKEQSGKEEQEQCKWKYCW